MKKGENIYKRKDGRWEGRYQDGFRSDGKVYYRSIYGKSYREVKLKLAENKSTKQKPITTKKLNMNEVYKQYIDSIQFNVKVSTISNYKNLYDNHIKLVFGGCQIDKINNDMINKFISNKLSSNLSTKFISDIVCLLKTILKFAIKRKWIEQQEYDFIKFKVATKPIEIFTEMEIALIEKRIIDNPLLLDIGILLSLSMGLRIGEICALKVSDIDISNEIISINKTLQRIKNPNADSKRKTIIIVEKPKSIYSERIIPIPNFLLSVLEKVICNYNKNAYFLTGVLDKFIEPRMLEKHYKQFLKSIGVIYKNFHTLRHTFATVSLRNNIFDIKTLSELLGHSSVKITYNYYLHTDIATQKRQMQRLNDEFISRQESCMLLQNKWDLGASSAF